MHEGSKKMIKRVVIVLLIVLTSFTVFALYRTLAYDTSVVENTPSTTDLDYTFQIGNSSIKQLVVEPNETRYYDVVMYNPNPAKISYGIYYEMVSPTTKPDDYSIVYKRRSRDKSSGVVSKESSIQLSIEVVNNTGETVTVKLGSVAGYVKGGELTLEDGQVLIPEEVVEDYRFNISKIDSATPTNFDYGFYDLSNYNCKNGATVTYNPYTKMLSYSKLDNCNLEFTTKSSPLLKDIVNIGDYIGYTGNNRCSGTSCQGHNAYQDSDTTNYTYGYCNSSNYKFYTYGWRVAYIKDDSVYIVAAGSPECVASIASNSTTTIESLKTASLKYCNTDYLQGGVCDDTTAHPLRGGDYYNITKGLFGDSGARGLYTYTDSSYDSGVSITSSNICYNYLSIKECGYNNDLIDNGGYYWFGSAYSSSGTLSWYPFSRHLYYNSSSFVAFGVRPVLKLDSTITAIGGSGTMDRPYTISKRSGV